MAVTIVNGSVHYASGQRIAVSPGSNGPWCLTNFTSAPCYRSDGADAYYGGVPAENFPVPSGGTIYTVANNATDATYSFVAYPADVQVFTGTFNVSSAQTVAITPSPSVPVMVRSLGTNYTNTWYGLSSAQAGDHITTTSSSNNAGETHLALPANGTFYNYALNASTPSWAAVSLPTGTTVYTGTSYLASLAQVAVSLPYDTMITCTGMGSSFQVILVFDTGQSSYSGLGGRNTKCAVKASQTFYMTNVATSGGSIYWSYSGVRLDA